MRKVIRSLMVGVTGLTSCLMMAVSLAPATPAEQRALGPDHTRIERVEMRLAGVLMRVAPEFTVQQFANATELPPHLIRAQLLAKAEGRSLEEALGANQTATNVPTNRREMGSAVFVTVN